MKYCTKCGRQLDDSIRFCPGCGQAVPQETGPGKPKKYLAVIIGIVALAVIAGMFFLGRMYGNAESIAVGTEPWNNPNRARLDITMYKGPDYEITADSVITLNDLRRGDYPAIYITESGTNAAGYELHNYALVKAGGYYTPCLIGGIASDGGDEPGNLLQMTFDPLGYFMSDLPESADVSLRVDNPDYTEAFWTDSASIPVTYPAGFSLERKLPDNTEIVSTDAVKVKILGVDIIKDCLYVNLLADNYSDDELVFSFGYSGMYLNGLKYSVGNSQNIIPAKSSTIVSAWIMNAPDDGQLALESINTLDFRFEIHDDEYSTLVGPDAAVSISFDRDCGILQKEYDCPLTEYASSVKAEPAQVSASYDSEPAYSADSNPLNTDFKGFITAGYIDETYCSVAVKANGTVEINFDPSLTYEETALTKEVSNWQNVRRLLFISDCTAALDKDGKILCTSNCPKQSLDELSKWNNVKDIQCLNGTLVALCGNGTVKAANLSSNDTPDGLDRLCGLTGVVSVSTSGDKYAAVLDTGRIVSNVPEVEKAASSWDAANGFYLADSFCCTTAMAVASDCSVSAVVIPQDSYYDYKTYEKELNSLTNVRELCTYEDSCTVFALLNDASALCVRPMYIETDPEESVSDFSYIDFNSFNVRNVEKLVATGENCLYISEGNVYYFSPYYDMFPVFDQPITCIYRSASEDDKAVDCDYLFALLANGKTVPVYNMEMD